MFHYSIINGYNTWFTQKIFHFLILCFLTQCFKNTTKILILLCTYSIYQTPNKPLTFTKAKRNHLIKSPSKLLPHTQENCPTRLIAVTFTVTFSLLHIDAELVLLVAAHVSVTHVEDGVILATVGGDHKVQFDLAFLLPISLLMDSRELD